MPRQSTKNPKDELNDFLRTKEYVKYVNILKKIKVKDIDSPFETLAIKESEKLRTNTVLDDLLGVGGGVSAGSLVELYGGYGSAKTQTLETMVAEASQVGTVMYIDSEFTWCPERQDQICKARNLDVELMHKNFMICRPEDYEEQLAKILTLPSPLDLASMDRPPFKLICVDSLLALVDDSRDFSGREKLPTRARIIRDMLHALRKHAIANKCAVVFTNQVSAVPDVTKFMASYQKEQGTGGNVTRHKPDIVLYYRRTKDPIRIARLMDSSSLPVGERVFMINEKGIDDIPDGDQAKWMQEMNTSSVDYTKIIDEVQSEDAEIDEIVDNAEVEDVVEE